MNDILQHAPEFIGNHLYLVLAFVGVLIALVFGEVSHLTRGYRALTPAGLTQLINRENALVVDLQSNSDYDKGHIAGAKHVSMTQFDPESKDLAKVRDLPVALYCKNGQTSAGAAKRLVKAGFTKVHWLDGGLNAWLQADLPLTR